MGKEVVRCGLQIAHSGCHGRCGKAGVVKCRSDGEHRSAPEATGLRDGLEGGA